VFILTHHAREPVEKEGGTTYTFVTEGIERTRVLGSPTGVTHLSYRVGRA
jgi:hypothetical protein